MGKTKGGKKSWSSKHRNACTALFNKYNEDPTVGASYEEVDAGNKDYVDLIYNSHEVFQETEKLYFKKHFMDRAAAFRLELEERGARRQASELLSSFCYWYCHICFSFF